VGKKKKDEGKRPYVVPKLKKFGSLTLLTEKAFAITTIGGNR
jgi:hypothetical protein